MSFSTLGLSEPIVRSLASEGYSTPTPIQSQAIPHVLAGRDILGCARTGTGKTAAFALPIVHRLSAEAATGGATATPRNTTRPAVSRRQARALILAPTRELAAQIAERVEAYGRGLGLRHAVIFGGVSQHSQVQAVRAGVDIIVATPGRLMDLMNQGHVSLDGIGVLVLDEADRMLDMGFIHDIRRIVATLPRKRQTLLFSATMPAEIRSLAESLLTRPVNVQVDPVGSTAKAIEQSAYVVTHQAKAELLRSLLSGEASGRTLVFTRTKHRADRVVKDLVRHGIRAAAIHGNKSQNARTRALEEFRSTSPPVLVATDIASRGIDVDEIAHVVNFDLPVDAETYVHRIGRTARAGATGAAVSFCDPSERGHLRTIERLTGSTLVVRGEAPKTRASEDGAGSAPRRSDARQEPQRQAGRRHAVPQRSARSSPSPTGVIAAGGGSKVPHRQDRTRAVAAPSDSARDDRRWGALHGNRGPSRRSAAGGGARTRRSAKG